MIELLSSDRRSFRGIKGKARIIANESKKGKREVYGNVFHFLLLSATGRLIYY